jgi:hypothetical protein
VLDTIRDRKFNRLGHSEFVNLIRTRRRYFDDVERKSKSARLRFNQGSADCMHRDSVGRGIHGDQQRYDIDVDIATDHVKGHRAVFPAAPTHPRSTTIVHSEMLVRSTVEIRVCSTVLNTGYLAMREHRLDCSPPRVRLTIVLRCVTSVE